MTSVGRAMSGFASHTQDRQSAVAAVRAGAAKLDGDAKRATTRNLKEDLTKMADVWKRAASDIENTAAKSVITRSDASAALMGDQQDLIQADADLQQDCPQIQQQPG